MMRFTGYIVREEKKYDEIVLLYEYFRLYDLRNKKITSCSV